jgi:hypothetical protein
MFLERLTVARTSEAKMIFSANALTGTTAAPRYERSNMGVTGVLSLAASPTFAIMALLTYTAGGPEMLCAPAASPFTGMVAMYVLMSAFHLAPWLRLIADRRRCCGP